MKRIVGLLVGAAALVGALVPASSMGVAERGVDAKERIYSLEEVTEDFAQAVELVSERHPLLYSDRETLDRVVAEQQRRLRPGMSEIELYRLLLPVIEAVECGHSNIRLSKEYVEQMNRRDAVLPLGVTLVEEQLVVTDPGSYGGIPRGSRLDSINGRSADSIIDRLYALIPSDGTNLSSKRAKINNQFSYYYHTMIDEADTFELVYTEPGAESAERATVTGVPGAQMYANGRSLASIDLYLDYDALRHDYRGSVDSDTAYLQVGSFILAQRDFASFLEEFFAQVEEARPQKLVLDLRGNWGGPPRGSALLASYLFKEGKQYLDEDGPLFFFRYKRGLKPQENGYSGDLTVLTDGGVFSTTGHLVSLLRHHDRGLLVGEVTGGGASCTDSSRSATLRNSGLRLNYATRIYSTPAVENPQVHDPAGGGIQPDVPVQPTLEQLIQGRDPVLEVATGGRVSLQGGDSTQRR